MGYQRMERRISDATYVHFSESGSTAPSCILLLATSKGYLRGGRMWKISQQQICVINNKHLPAAVKWISHIVSLLLMLRPKSFLAVRRHHSRYCLCDGTGDASTEQVDVRLQNQDIGVVGRRPSQQLREVFQAEALQGAIGEEGKPWRMKTEERRRHWLRFRCECPTMDW